MTKTKLPKTKRTICAQCGSKAGPRRICDLKPTVNQDTMKPDGGAAYFCRRCS